MRLDSTILYNLVSWQGRERERERECVSFWPILLAIFPVKRVWEVVQRQPGPSESQALFKWCYHNTFVSTPSVSLTHSPTPAPHPSSSFINFFFYLCMSQLALNRLFNITWICDHMCAYLMCPCVYCCSCGRNIKDTVTLLRITYTPHADTHLNPSTLLAMAPHHLALQ